MMVVGVVIVEGVVLVREGEGGGGAVRAGEITIKMY